MFKFWFESRSLAVLQVYYDQPLKKPLPEFEKRLLRGAVNITRKDGGTPFDAATRFYAAYAETAVAQGRDLNEINFGGVLGRMFAMRNKMKFYDEHMAALKLVGKAESDRSVQTTSLQGSGDRNGHQIDLCPQSPPS